jgi:hypothetical protein
VTGTVRYNGPMQGLCRLVGLALFALVLAPGCRLGGGPPGEPPPESSARALAEARELWRLRPDGWRPRIEAALEAAVAAAPEWVAPQRLVDDLAREDLLGPETLAVRQAAVEEDPADAGRQYLLGRLQGPGGSERFERAAALDPRLSWAQHGLAWNLFQAGRPARARRHGRRALDLARGSHELGAFALAQSRYLAALDDDEAGVQLLLDTLADPRLDQPERTECRVALARLELAVKDLRERGAWRTLELLGEPRVSAIERVQLVADLLEPEAAAVLGDARAEALAALPPDLPGADEARARVLLAAGRPGLARAVLRSGPEDEEDTLGRRTALRSGAAGAAIEEWRAALPARVLDEQGLPAVPALRQLVVAARAAEDGPGRVAFGSALLAAGWFDEAALWADVLADEAPAEALELGRRAAAGQALLADLVEVLEHVDRGEPVLDLASGEGQVVTGLDDLLARLEQRFERFHGVFGGTVEDVDGSPRLSFGALAEIVHPGPRYSVSDEVSGLGAAGAAVPGLAAELDGLQRFGLFGIAPGGGGPDGAVLRRIGVEWRSGEHLGVPFAGTVVWCEGSDLPSRPERQGSRISGAALHEGYWIDVESVRAELPRVLALERDFLDQPTRDLDAVLAQHGAPLPAGGDPRAAAAWVEPLGEGQRVLLALLRDRARAGAGPGERLTLDDLLDVTALHEEGHLTDRARFLPLTRHWPGALALAMRAGLTPRGIARRLEYRAQLVALCEAADPRQPLADCLSAAERTGGVLAHGDAYRELVEDLLAVLFDEREAFPVLDPRRPFLHQLHLLAPEEVRAAGRSVARREGL